MSKQTAKKELRLRIRMERNAMSVSDRSASSKIICNKLRSLVEETNAKVIHLFLPMESEPNIFPFILEMLEAGKIIVTPKSLKSRKLKHLVLNALNELEDGIYGTKHPAGGIEYTGEYDLIIVPGLAFDSNNNRLGYGAGYYDTFLETQVQTPKFGICFPFQMIPNVPTEVHDVVLSGVIQGVE